MATLIINRGTEMANRFRKITYYVNGEPLGKIGFMESQKLELAAGTYLISASIGFAGAMPVSINLMDGETKHVKITCAIKSSPAQAALQLLSFLAIIISLVLFGDIPMYLLLGILLLWFIRDVVLTGGKPFFYYLTTGRNKYLEIHAI